MNRITATLALAGLLAGAPLAASATTPTECQGLIGELKVATETASFPARNGDKDRAGLVTKLDNASSSLSTTKLNAKKVADAAQKVSDYQGKLMELLNAGKITQTTYDALNYGVDGVNPGADDVQACIAEIQL